MKDTTDADNKSIKKKLKRFWHKKSWWVSHLYAQSDVILLADAFDRFLGNCIKIHKLDPAHFHSAAALSWKAYLKKTEVEVKLLTDNDMLLMVGKGIRGRMCQVILWRVNKRLCDKQSISSIRTWTICMDRQCCKSCL